MKATFPSDYLIAEGLDDHAFGEAVLSEYEADNEWRLLWQAWHFCFYTEMWAYPTVH